MDYSVRSILEAKPVSNFIAMLTDHLIRSLHRSRQEILQEQLRAVVEGVRRRFEDVVKSLKCKGNILNKFNIFISKNLM